MKLFGSFIFLVLRSYRDIFLIYPFFPLFLILSSAIFFSGFFPDIPSEILFIFSLLSFLFSFLFFIFFRELDEIFVLGTSILLFSLFFLYVKMKTHSGKFILGSVSSLSQTSITFSVDYVKGGFEESWRRTGGYIKVRYGDFKKFGIEDVDVFQRFILVCSKVVSFRPGWRYCVHPVYISRVGEGKSIFSSLRERSRSVISLLPFQREAGLLDSILFGSQEDYDKEIFFDFARFGIAHMIAISGSHFTAVALLGYLFGEMISYFIFMMMWRFLSGVKKFQHFLFRFTVLIQPFSLKLFFSLLFQFLFLVMCGFVKPAVRAFVMNVVFTISVLSGRNFSPLNALFASGFTIFLFEPADMYNISFLLSFCAVLFIVVFTTLPFREKFRYIFWSSVFASLGVLPICIYAGIPVSLISPISNIFFSPLFSAVIFLGVTGVFLSFFSEFFGVIPCFLASLIIKLIIFVTEIFSPFADLFTFPAKLSFPHEITFLILFSLLFFLKKVFSERKFLLISLFVYVSLTLSLFFLSRERIFVYGDFLVKEVRGIEGSEFYALPIRPRFNVSSLSGIIKGAKCFSLCFSQQEVIRGVPVCYDDERMCDFGNIR